ncbi:carbohydrate-binding protein [Metarhizium guizhouense ARSEF 977]|uniref:Carbohydrate-binding protein n=1 Tax=Metarhizium guizhouense (strain ARSEF 977) TaxID=1276136 RepID=A0A0B4GJV9_METGA|nr:carbohydrate-binding protein [Metarhizium guizhouense ARSEF 977]
MHFDETEVQWALGKQEGKYDVESVALHEIGHLLGMLHNSNEESVMYSRVRSNKLARKLSEDDKTGIRRLYPTWKRVGGSFTTNPILVSWSGKFTNLACVGGDGALRHRYQREPYGAWHPAGENFEHLGGKLAGNIAAVTRGEEHVNLFVRGQDNKCYSKWYRGGWSEWMSRGGDVQGDMAAYYDGTAWQPGAETWTSLAWDGAKWVPEGTEWTSLGGTALEDVAVVSSGVNHLYLFIRGADNTVYSKSYRDGTWETQ